MTEQTLKTQAQSLVERGKELVQQGNQRRLVFFKKDGEQLFETTATIAVAVVLVLMLTGFFSIPLAVIGAIIAMVMGIRVELQHHTPEIVASES